MVGQTQSQVLKILYGSMSLSFPIFGKIPQQKQIKTELLFLCFAIKVSDGQPQGRKCGDDRHLDSNPVHHTGCIGLRNNIAPHCADDARQRDILHHDPLQSFFFLLYRVFQKIQIFHRNFLSIGS